MKMRCLAEFFTHLNVMSVVEDDCFELYEAITAFSLQTKSTLPQKKISKTLIIPWMRSLMNSKRKIRRLPAKRFQLESSYWIYSVCNLCIISQQGP